MFSNLVPGREYDDLAYDAVELRVWLPEACRIALDEVTNVMNVTEAFWLRVVLLMHLYGEHEYRRMFAQRSDFFAPPRTVSPKNGRYGFSFSAAPGPTDPENPLSEPTTWVAPNLGKNMWPIKVFVPRQLKADLQHAAARTGVALSVYVREILITKLLGQALDRDSLSLFSPELLHAGQAWESGVVNDSEVLISAVQSEGAEITHLSG